MSSISYDVTRTKVNFEVKTNTFNLPEKEYIFSNESCIGQDAGYILRKRAMIMDLWNLIPDTPKENTLSSESSLLFDLPVFYNSTMEGSAYSFDKQIPVQ